MKVSKINNSGLLLVALINFTKSFNNIDFVATSKLEETNLFLRIESSDT